MKKSGQTLEKEFLGDRQSKLDAGNIKVLYEVSAPYALLEASFNMDDGRLNWSLVANRIETDVKTISAWYGVGNDEACKLFLREQIATKELLGSAYLINDMLDIVLFGDVASFEKIFDTLMWPGGHIYLLGEKGDWCLNVTMENDLYFGCSPPRVLSS